MELSQYGTIKVPLHVVGQVIGRGGRKLQAIELATNTRIAVSKPGPGDVTIRYSERLADSYEDAVQLIYKLAGLRPDGSPVDAPGAVRRELPVARRGVLSSAALRAIEASTGTRVTVEFRDAPLAYGEVILEARPVVPGVEVVVVAGDTLKAVVAATEQVSDWLAFVEVRERVRGINTRLGMCSDDAITAAGLQVSHLPLSRRQRRLLTEDKVVEISMSSGVFVDLEQPAEIVLVADSDVRLRRAEACFRGMCASSAAARGVGCVSTVHISGLGKALSRHPERIAALSATYKVQLRIEDPDYIQVRAATDASMSEAVAALHRIKHLPCSSKSCVRTAPYRAGLCSPCSAAEQQSKSASKPKPTSFRVNKTSASAKRAQRTMQSILRSPASVIGAHACEMHIPHLSLEDGAGVASGEDGSAGDCAAGAGADYFT